MHKLSWRIQSKMKKSPTRQKERNLPPVCRFGAEDVTLTGFDSRLFRDRIRTETQEESVYSSGSCRAIFSNSPCTARKASTTSGSKWVPLFREMISTDSSWVKDGL